MVGAARSSKKLRAGRQTGSVAPNDSIFSLPPLALEMVLLDLVDCFVQHWLSPLCLGFLKEL